MVQELLNKYIWLVQTFVGVGARGLSLDEIGSRWERRWGEGFSRRSFCRHREVVEELFGITIGCNRSTNRYFIDRSEEVEDGKEASAWLINAFTVDSLLSMSKKRLSGRVSLEDIPSGQKWLTTIMEAMDGNLKLTIEYKKYLQTESESLTVHPYAVKESEKRWYLVGWCEQRKAMRVYGLDRIVMMTVTDADFRMPEDFDVDFLFRESFGIFLPEDGQKSETVVLHVTDREARYLRDLPLHPTQEEITPNVFSIKVIPNGHLVMELCKRGDRIEVLEPEFLREEVQEEHRKALARYEKH